MNSRNLLWQLPLLLLLSGPLWWGSIASFLQVENKSTKWVPRPESSFILAGAFLSQSTDGKDEIFLHAGRIYSQKNQSVMQLRDVEALILGEKDQSFNMKGGQASYDSEKEILTILDDVMVVMENVKVVTSALRYLTKFKKVKSAADVELIGEGMRVSGTSFMYDLQTGDFRIGKRVRCDIW